jgi:hypothetical protein
MNLKKLENIIKLFRTYLDYQQPKVSIVKDNFTEEEETEKFILYDKIKKNSSDDKEDIKIKKVGV